MLKKLLHIRKCIKPTPSKIKTEGKDFLIMNIIPLLVEDAGDSSEKPFSTPSLKTEGPGRTLERSAKHQNKGIDTINVCI